MIDNAPYGGWVKIHRSFLDWGWYGNTNCVRLALHFLLRVNYQPKKWQGIDVGRGQMITSRIRLCEEIGLSDNELRAAWKRLTDCGFLTNEATNRYTLVTICNYGQYQDGEGDEQPAEQPTNNQPITSEQPTNNQPITNQQPTNNQPITTTKESKKERIKERKNKREEELAPAFVKFQKWIDDNAPSVGKLKEPFSEDQFFALKQDFPIDKIQELLQAMHNWKPLLTKNVNANSTFRKWAKRDDDERNTNKHLANPSSDKQHRDDAFTSHIAEKMRRASGNLPDIAGVAPIF